MNTAESLLSLENVEVTFDEESALMQALPERLKERLGWTGESLRAVDDVSLDIGENDLVAVVGESGSGKTTLGKTAVALQEPTAGTVNYRGYDVWEVKRQTRVDDLFYEDIRKALQIVHQDAGTSLNPYRTLRATLSEPLTRWFPEMSSADKRERILELFRACGLTPALEYLDRYPHELSGGEQQRAVLVRAMLLEPDLIFADEPVSALDTSLRIEIMDLMLELQEQFGTSFFVVSHNLEHARYLASNADGWIAIMYLGEIVEIGPVEEVIENPKHPYTQILKWATLSSHPEKARAALEAESPLRESDAPDILHPPDGCRFHPRCPKAREACVDEPPKLKAGDSTAHRAACFRDRSTHEYWHSEPLKEAGERENAD
jgi:peptide/nickel transport system ATP-binding protein